MNLLKVHSLWNVKDYLSFNYEASKKAFSFFS